LFCTKPPDLSGIIAAGGKLSPKSSPTRLLAALRRAHELYEVWRTSDLFPPHATAEQEMAKLARSADAILRICLIDAKAGVSRENIKPAYWTKLAIQAGGARRSVYDAMAGGGAQRLIYDAIATVASLKAWGAAVTKSEQVRNAAQRAAADDDTSADTWLIADELPRIYERHFRKLTISHGSANYGRGVAFVSACLREIGGALGKRKPPAIAKLIERRRRKRRAHRPKQGTLRA
jgi:hypothetical protein